MTDELKPCAHCGSAAHWRPTYTDRDSPGTVSCECGATMIVSGTKAQRIAAWNRRHPDPDAIKREARNSRPTSAGQSEGTSRCPICGNDTPHNHSAQEVREWREAAVIARQTGDKA